MVNNSTNINKMNNHLWPPEHKKSNTGWWLSVMVYKSNNINKTNNKISPKESLNSDSKQFHQYQQNEQSPLILTHRTQKNTTT